MKDGGPLTELRRQQLRDEAVTRRNNPNKNLGKYEPAGGEKETYVSPNYGDGGWHTTPGTQQFTIEWEPRNDRILVQLLPRPERSEIIATPQNAAPDKVTRIGIVLKTGPGKWIRGTWWKFHTPKPHWEWIPGHREEMVVRPGMQIVIGQWHDWSSSDAGYGNEIVICQQADVRAILDR